MNSRSAIWRLLRPSATRPATSRSGRVSERANPFPPPFEAAPGLPTPLSGLVVGAPWRRFSHLTAEIGGQKQVSKTGTWPVIHPVLCAIPGSRLSTSMSSGSEIAGGRMKNFQLTRRQMLRVVGAAGGGVAVSVLLGRIPGLAEDESD